MDGRLRVATAGAFAALLATVVMLALRDVGGGGVYLGESNGTVTTLSTPLFAAALTMLSFGLAYIVTGITLAPPRVAVPGLALVTLVIGLYTGALGRLIGGLGPLFDLYPPWVRWTARAMLAAVWVVAGIVLLLERRARGRLREERRVRLTVLVVYAGLFGGYFLTLRETSPTVGSLNLFGPEVDLLLFTVALGVYPILQVAAIDFGEWGQLASERISAEVQRRRGDLLTAFAALACMAMAAFGYARTRPRFGLLTAHRMAGVGQALVLLGAALALVLIVGRAMGVHRRRWPATLNFGWLFCVCVLVGSIVPPVAAALVGAYSSIPAPHAIASESGRYEPGADVVSVRGGTSPTTYSMLLPRGWVVHSGALTWASTYDGKGGYQRVVVATFQGGLPLSFVAHALRTEVGRTTSVGRWQRAEVQAPLPGLLWVRPLADDSATYVLYETVNGGPAHSFELGKSSPLFEAVADSFRVAGEPPANPPPAAANETPAATRQAHDDKLRVVGLAVEAGVFVLLLAGAAIFRGAWSPRAVGAILFLGLVMLMEALFFFDSIGRYFFGPHAHWWYVGGTGLLFGVGVLCLVALVEARLRRRDESYRRRLAVGVAGLVGATSVLQLMEHLYDQALHASQVSIWAAVILLLAVAWDVTMSGESMTNHGSPHLPRATRVLAFFGYTILLSAIVLFYSGQRIVATGGKAEPDFEPEAITQAALFRIAFPLLVLLFLLRLGRGPEPAREERPAETLSPDAVDTVESELADLSAPQATIEHS